MKCGGGVNTYVVHLLGSTDSDVRTLVQAVHGSPCATAVGHKQSDGVVRAALFLEVPEGVFGAVAEDSTDSLREGGN